MKMNKPKSFIVLYGGKFIRAYHENDIDDLIAKKNAEISMLKRALYKVCANWANITAFEKTEGVGIGYYNSVAEKWHKMKSKCLAKVKELTDETRMKQL